MPQNEEFQPSGTPFDFSKYQAPYEVCRARTVEKLIPWSHGENAIDIGCGPGYYTRMLSEKGWRTTAIDTDGQNIEGAKRYAVETRVGEAVNTLAAEISDRYDLALALEIIEHMPLVQGRDLLQNISRVLKPDGRLILSTPNKYSLEGLSGYYWGEKIARWGKWTAWDKTHVHIYSSPGIIRLLKACGFSIGKVVGFHYQGQFPLIGKWRLPLMESGIFPLNRLGFNIIVECQKK